MICSRIFRFPVDVWPTLIVASGIAIGLVAVVLDLHGHALWIAVLASFACRVMAPAHQHNHAHLSLFRSRALDFIHDVFLPLATGHATVVWEIQHGLGHHRQFLDPENDVAGNERFAFTATWAPLARRIAFTVLADALTIPDAWRIAAAYPKKRRALRRRLVFHVALQAVWLVALLALSAHATLAVFVVPNVLLRWFVVWVSYAQHDGAPGTNVYDASNTHFGFANVILLNVGHHTAHHEKPTLHWSLLPERTAKILDRIPPSCLRGHPEDHVVTPRSTTTLAGSSS